MRAKVFNIGFPKTGTMSLGRALRILGYNVCPHLTLNGTGRLQVPQPVTIESLAEACRPIVREYDAFRNFPWSLIYKELDQAFPGAKFILTRREPQAWIRSVVGHFGEKQNALARLAYGPDRPPRGNEDVYIARYLQHNADVIAYFEGRPDALLVLDLENADWEPLCRFLGRRRPIFRGFPHRNRAVFRDEKLSRVKKVFKYNLQEIIRPWTKQAN